jgi:hypothetical protein
MSRRVAAWIAAVALLLGSSLGVTFAAPAGAANANPSQVTKSGKGAFTDLSVTVAQTKNLVDQVVQVSWKGGDRTVPGSGQFSYDYLQIMQCWGDDPAGPSREQCQFGGLTGDDRGGAQSSTRQVSYGSTLIDPDETLKQEPGSFKQKFVPFKSVTGKVEDGTVSEFYDAFTTNEVPFAATRGDGTGNDYFSVQSTRDAPGLGCGEPVVKNGKTVGRKCWLVVVPRGDREVDGSQATLSKKLVSSPLSASNWKNRIVFPLEFDPIGRPCPLGRAERKTLGQENIAEAVTRWQPALCQNGGPVFGYSQVSDDAARRDLVTDDSGMSFISRPLAAASVPADSKLVYAPVGISGIAIAFNVDRQTPIRAPADVKARDGERVKTLRLTPRLVAKLLTQSYTRAANINAPSVQGNPTNLLKDPEFTALNAEYDGLTISLPELQLPAGRADITERVWNWILQDADAKQFLKGAVDPWGMKVNTNYKTLEFPRDDYPKAETYCIVAPDRPDLCTLDAHPYAASLQDSARNASRGDFRGLTYWDPIAVPIPAYKRDRPQPSGTRAMLALTDTASAARYGLETAQLLNPAGDFVAPTPVTMAAASARQAPAPAGAPRQPILDGQDPKAYPLTNITYAVVDASRADTSAKKDYAAFLRYAAGPGQRLGQQPGQLPAGYAPLTKPLSTQTSAAAAAIAATSETAPTGESTGGDGAGSDSGSTSGTDSAALDAPAVPPGEVLPADPTTAEGAAAGSPVLQARTVAATTPLDTAGVGRLVPLAALIVGCAAAVAGVALVRVSNRV